MKLHVESPETHYTRTSGLGRNRIHLSIGFRLANERRIELRHLRENIVPRFRSRRERAPKSSTAEPFLPEFRLAHDLERRLFPRIHSPTTHGPIGPSTYSR